MGGRRAEELRALIAGAGFKGISVRPNVKPAAKRCLQQFRSQDRAAGTGGSSRRRCDQTGAHPFLFSLLPSRPLARLWTSPSFGCVLLKKIRARFFSDES